MHHRKKKVNYFSNDDKGVFIYSKNFSFILGFSYSRKEL